MGDDGVGQAPAELLGRLEGCAERCPRAAESRGNLVVEIEAGVAKDLFSGELNTECVRLMHELCDQNASCHNPRVPPGPFSTLFNGRSGLCQMCIQHALPAWSACRSSQARP